MPNFITSWFPISCLEPDGNHKKNLVLLVEEPLHKNTMTEYKVVSGDVPEVTPSTQCDEISQN